MRLLLAILAAALLAALPAAAQAETGPCLPDGSGPTCHFWKLKVTDVNDGDTLGGDVLGDGRRKREVVRFSGVQTMELKRYHPKRRTGECHAVRPTLQVERLIRRSGGVVRISSQDPHALQDVRLRRWVAVRQGGRWVDLGELLIREGKALWLGGLSEWAWNERYARAEQLAKRDGRYIWNQEACGAGPSAGLPIQLWVQWNPVGGDRDHGGEWVKIRNLSPDRPLPLGGWTLRDASHLYFHFRRGTVVAPGDTVTVHVRSGVASASSLFWGLNRLVFENFSRDGRYTGGGAYLYDPHGDVRASMQYPCLVECANPLPGALSLTPIAGGTKERVLVRNASGAPVDLYGYALDVPGGMIPFKRGTVLQPGALRIVDVPDLHRMPDAGGYVQVVTFSNVQVACSAWGRGRCPAP